ncbi:MAG: hypothetical protein EX270_04210 [Pseudomonadales bacterium]|nr:MAG: hypothetical protein EX270_04210 [Pseudomonadales bacterium]
MSTNNSLAEALARAKPVKLPERHQMRRSAVAVVLDSDVLADASLLLIRRAQHERDPWSGRLIYLHESCAAPRQGWVKLVIVLCIDAISSLAGPGKISQ